MCQALLRNGSAHSVTLECTAKKRVQFTLWFWITRQYFCFNAIQRGIETSSQIWFSFLGGKTPSGPCAAGYVCIGGASEPSPLDGPTGFLCPSGFFCPVGTSAPKPCPKGTFRSYFFTFFSMWSHSIISFHLPPSPIEILILSRSINLHSDLPPEPLPGRSDLDILPLIYTLLSLIFLYCATRGPPTLSISDRRIIMDPHLKWNQAAIFPPVIRSHTSVGAAVCNNLKKQSNHSRVIRLQGLDA